MFLKVKLYLLEFNNFQRYHSMNIYSKSIGMAIFIHYVQVFPFDMIIHILSYKE
jgi:hypothetical protein